MIVDAVTHDTLWQVIGTVAAVAPVLVIGAWLALASRRRDAAERAQPPPET